MRHDDQGAMTAIEWGVKKHWLTMTDARLASGLNTTIEEIERVRDELGLIRAKSTESWKEWARRHFTEMTDEEKLEVFHSLDMEFALKMAEGNPASTGELTVNHEPLKIDIRQQVIKVYGPNPIAELDGPADGAGAARMFTDGEGGRRTTATG